MPRTTALHAPPLRLVKPQHTRTRPKRRNQPRLREGPRQPIAGAVNRAIEHAIRAEMRRFRVSRSFVVAVALAYTFGIDLEACEDYHGQR